MRCISSRVSPGGLCLGVVDPLRMILVVLTGLLEDDHLLATSPAKIV
jgi:hypothetical protein